MKRGIREPRPQMANRGPKQKLETIRVESLTHFLADIRQKDFLRMHQSMIYLNLNKSECVPVRSKISSSFIFV